MLTRSFFRTPAQTLFRSYYPTRSPFRFDDEAERSFAGARQRLAHFPAVNVWSNEDEAVVTAELPGMDAADVEVALEKDRLSLKGERKAQLQDGEHVHRQERWSGTFERTLKLPFDVQNDKVKAQFSHGVLTIKLPKAEVSKPRKIAVKTA